MKELHSKLDCLSCVNDHSCCEFMSAQGPVMSRRHCFVPILRNLWLLQSFYPLFCGSLRALGKRYDTDAPFVAEHPTIIYSLHFHQFSATVLIAIHYF